MCIKPHQSNFSFTTCSSRKPEVSPMSSCIVHAMNTKYYKYFTRNVSCCCGDDLLWSSLIQVKRQKQRGSLWGLDTVSWHFFYTGNWDLMELRLLIDLWRTVVFFTRIEWKSRSSRWDTAFAPSWGIDSESWDGVVTFWCQMHRIRTPVMFIVL